MTLKYTDMSQVTMVKNTLQIEAKICDTLLTFPTLNPGTAASPILTN